MILQIGGNMKISSKEESKQLSQLLNRLYKEAGGATWIWTTRPWYGPHVFEYHYNNWLKENKDTTIVDLGLDPKQEEYCREFLNSLRNSNENI